MTDHDREPSPSTPQVPGLGPHPDVFAVSRAAVEAAAEHEAAVTRVRAALLADPEPLLALREHAVALTAGPLFVRGGSPTALVLRDALDDPEVRARLAERFAELGRVVGEWIDSLRPAMEQAARSLAQLAATCREAGLLPDDPPQLDPQARALWHVQHRSTGPGREPAGRQRRPRRLP